MKEKLINNIEKIALLLCVAVAGWFIYSAVTMEGYKRKPEDIVKITNDADRHVRRNPVKEDDLTSPDLAEIKEKQLGPIEPGPFALPTKYQRIFEFGKQFRGMPEILAPSQPLVQANRGAFEVFALDENGYRKTSSVPANQVTGLPRSILPPNQTDGFAEGQWNEDLNFVLMQTGNSELYKKYQLPVPPAGEIKDVEGQRRLRFGDVTVKERKGAQAAGARGRTPPRTNARQAGSQLVEQYLDEVVGLHFVEVVAEFPHKEQILAYVEALRETVDLVGVRYASVDIERQELKADDTWSAWRTLPTVEQLRIAHNLRAFEEDEYARAALPGLAMSTPFFHVTELPLLGIPNLKNEAPAEYDPKLMGGAATPAAQPGRTQPTTARRPGPGPAVAPQVAPVAPVANNRNRNNSNSFSNHHEVEHALLRYFDYTVQPGRSYKYRVRVRVFNPNHRRADVAEAAFSDRDFLVGPWSEESEVVHVPTDIDWFVVGTANQATYKPDLVTLEIFRWLPKMGEWISTGPKNFKTGEMIGLSTGKEPIQVLEFDQVGNKWAPKSEELGDMLNTKTTLLDIFGGQIRLVYGRKAKTQNFPKEVVVVNQYGDLVRHFADRDAGSAQRNMLQTAVTEALAQVGAAPSTTSPDPGDTTTENPAPNPTPMPGNNNPPPRKNNPPTKKNNNDPIGF